MVCTFGAEAVPNAEFVDGEFAEEFDGARHVIFVDVVVPIVPSVAHWAVAVADVEGFGFGDDAFGASVGTGDDDVEFAEIELFVSEGHEFEVELVFGFGEREVLDEGGFDLGVLELGKFFFVINRGEDWRVWEHLVKSEVDAFGAALVGHPIKNEGNFGIHAPQFK